MSSVSSPGHSETLKDEKFTLLQRWFNLKDAILAESIALQYNSIVEAEKLDRTSLSDPLKVFPSEISLQIITEAVIDDGRIITDDLLSLTLVSSSWARSIVTTPALWTDIVVGVGLREADSLAKLSTCLVLSDKLRLSLHIPQGVHQWASYVRIILPHVHRVSRICVYQSVLDADAEQEQQFESPELSALGSFPILEDFSAFETVDFRGLNSLGMDPVPFLPEVMTGRVPEGMIPHSKNAFITLNDDSAHHLVGELQRWKLATTLHIDSSSTVNFSTLSPDQRKLLEGVDDTIFAKLREIQVSDFPHPLVYEILFRSDNVVKLSLGMTWKRLSLFLPNVHLCRALDDLALSINASSDPNHVFKLPDHNSISTLSNLWVNIFGEIRRSPPPWLTTNLRTFFQTCIHVFPEVRTLEINYSSTDEWEHYVSSLPKLRRLLLHISSRDPTWRVVSSSLEYLFLSPEISMKFHPRSAIICPNLVQFHLGSEFNYSVVRQPEPWIQSLQPLLPLNSEENQSFRSLVVLETVYPHWRLNVFLSLRRIVFGERTRNMSQLLIDIILDPLLCPSLDTLAFACFPEWDYLFLLLERRNCLPRASGTSRIKTIELPSCISYTLLKPLTDLVAGRLTLRPSNHELSISEIAPICFDPNVPGCMECIWSMQSCSTMPVKYTSHSVMQSITRMGMGVPVADRGDTSGVAIPTRAPPPSLDMVEWIKTRAEREIKWRLQLDTWLKSYYRIDICPERFPQRPCIITEHTLCDVPIA